MNVRRVFMDLENKSKDTQSGREEITEQELRVKRNGLAEERYGMSYNNLCGPRQRAINSLIEDKYKLQNT